MKPSVVEIDVLTYGGLPVLTAKESFQSSADNSRIGRAAAELASIALKEGRRVNVHIPGATFFSGYCGNEKTGFSGVADASRIEEKVRATLLRKGIDTRNLSITTQDHHLNTATQLNDIEERDRQYGSDIERRIICSDWQKKDVAQLMKGRLKNTSLTTDLEIYENAFGEGGRKFANYLRGTPTDQLKRDGLQAKIFRVLNIFDRRGFLRTLASRYFRKSGKGIGIADIDYRGMESGAYSHLERRYKALELKREHNS